MGTKIWRSYGSLGLVRGRLGAIDMALRRSFVRSIGDLKILAMDMLKKRDAPRKSSGPCFCA